MEFFVNGGDHDGWIVVGSLEELREKGEATVHIQSRADVPPPWMMPPGGAFTVGVIAKRLRLMDIREEAFLDVIPRAALARRLIRMPNAKERNREVWMTYAEHSWHHSTPRLQMGGIHVLPDDVLRDRDIMIKLIQLGFQGKLDVEPPDLEVSAAYLKRWGRLEIWPTDEAWLEQNIGRLSISAFRNMSPETRDRLALEFVFANVPTEVFSPWCVDEPTAESLVASVSPPVAAKAKVAIEWIAGVLGERPRLSGRSTNGPNVHLWGVHVVARILHKMFGNHNLGANELRSQLRSFPVDALVQICEDAVGLVSRVRARKSCRAWNYLAQADENLKPQLDASHVAELLQSEMRCRKVAKKDYPDDVINFLGSHLSNASDFQAQFQKITKKRDRDAFEADNSNSH